jgi:hypothetical protein
MKAAPVIADAAFRVSVTRRRRSGHITHITKPIPLIYEKTFFKIFRRRAVRNGGNGFRRV